MLFNKLCYDCEVIILEYDGGKRDAFDAVLQHERFKKQRALMAFTGKECSHALSGSAWFDYIMDSVHGFNVLTVDEATTKILRDEGFPLLVIWLEPSTIYASLQASKKASVTLKDIQELLKVSEELVALELEELNDMVLELIDMSVLCEYALSNFKHITDFEKSLLFDHDFVEFTEYEGVSYFIISDDQ